jgi:5-hydroxyisourate hydrolase
MNDDTQRREPAGASLSTHVLDLVRGMPGAGLPVRLERRRPDGWAPVAAGYTDVDGRWRADEPVEPGVYRWVFHPGDDAFFPEIVIAFRVGQATRIHVPLLLSAYGYSTYKGS